MHINDIHLLYEYNYWVNKKLLTASINITQAQFIKPAALLAEYGLSSSHLDFTVFLNELKS